MLKAALGTQWPMTSLLDMLKETDFRVGFTDTFKSPTAWETMERAALQPRLLLCLYGLGTNAGLKRMNAEEHGPAILPPTALGFLSANCHRSVQPDRPSICGDSDY
jgi:hypothetical protein